MQIGEEPDRIVAAVPPKRQGKRQKAARSGAGDTNRRSSDVGWTGNDFVKKPDGQTGCGFCGMSGPSHPASKCRALQKLKLEGKPIPSRHPGFPLLTFKQKEANKGSAMEEIDSRKKSLRDGPSCVDVSRESFFTDGDFFHDEGENPTT